MFKGKVKISFNYDNQTLNSRIAVFDKLIERSEGTTCEARRTSPYCLSEASLRANVPSCPMRDKLCTAARRCQGYRGNPLFCFSFAGVFFFK